MPNGEISYLVWVGVFHFKKVMVVGPENNLEFRRKWGYDNSEFGGGVVHFKMVPNGFISILC